MGETHNVYEAELKDTFDTRTCGKSKFKMNRPKHILFSSDMPHNVCCCDKHDNFISANNALHKLNRSYPKYTNVTLSLLVCAMTTNVESVVSGNYFSIFTRKTFQSPNGSNYIAGRKMRMRRIRETRKSRKKEQLMSWGTILYPYSLSLWNTPILKGSSPAISKNYATP